MLDIYEGSIEVRAYSLWTGKAFAASLNLFTTELYSVNYHVDEGLQTDESDIMLALA